MVPLRNSVMPGIVQHFAMPTKSYMTLTLVIVSLLCHVTCSAPVVRAPWGSIQGVDIEGQGGRKLSGYLGIPFALPPTGELRWRKPQPHPGPGDGHVFVADTLMPACPQELPGLGVYNGIDEDCLKLNVFVPLGADSFTAPVPVMIFIHGGGFSMGDAPTYRPTKLVSDGGVIVVTVQYRLGTLGFLATGDDDVLGNFGLWDQTLAIRWVKDNIRAFGGDPEAITIFGESAGSMSTGFHTLSPQSRGLFQRAVMQSGTPNGMSGFTTDEGRSLKILSQELGCEADSKPKMVECLKTRSADDIVNATSVLIRQSGNLVLFLPRVDGEWLPRDPLELLQDEEYVRESGVGDLDLMIGFNNNEGAMLLMTMVFTEAPLESVTDPNFFRVMLDTCVRLSNRGQADEMKNQVVEFLYRGADSGTNNTVPVPAILQMYGDVIFGAPTMQWIRTLAAQPHKGSRYMYVFDHDFSCNNQGPAPGTHHGDELMMEFDLLLKDNTVLLKLNKTGISEQEEPLSDFFVKSLTTFAKTGNPNTEVKDLPDVDWPEFTTEDEAYLAMSLTPRVERDMYRDRIALWLNLLPKIASATHPQQGEEPHAATNKEEL